VSPKITLAAGRTPARRRLGAAAKKAGLDDANTDWLGVGLRALARDEEAREKHRLAAANPDSSFHVFWGDTMRHMERARERNRATASLDEADYAGMGAA
jgi:hypothetical protein